MIRLMAVIEASTVTGPAKNLLEFCRLAREPEDNSEGVEVSLVTFQRTDAYSAPTTEIETEFTAAARASGVRFLVLPERKRFDRGVVPMLRHVAREWAPDIVQTHAVKSHCLLRLSGLWHSHPWVAWHHAYTTTDFKMRCYNQLDRWALRAPAKVMTMNQRFVRDLEGIGVPPERIQVLHNATRIGWNAGVSADTVATLRARLGVQAGEKVVLSVGRFSQEKGHIDLIRAFAQLKKQRPDVPVRLVIVGEGREKAALSGAAQELGVADTTVFAGQVRDVGPFFALADVMALPSLNEGSPNVLLESISAGVPVVSTRVGGVPEMVVHDESALLVEPHDVNALASSLLRVLTDGFLASTLKNNALHVAERYSPEVRVAALLKMYRDLARETATNPAAARWKLTNAPFHF
jgi:glycosyltransferase involved in cell wall biosynthesis